MLKERVIRDCFMLKDRVIEGIPGNNGWHLEGFWLEISPPLPKSFDEQNTFRPKSFDGRNTFYPKSFDRQNTFHLKSFDARNTFCPKSFDGRNIFATFAYKSI